MSIYGMMRTGASGMQAQSNRLGTVSDNIANASTTGYKAASTEFSSLVVNESTTSYVAGGVETSVRYGISTQGTLQFSTSPYDLAVQGSGFLLVSDSEGAAAMTRAGAFVPDGDGQLVNSAGFRLLGLPVDGSTGSSVVLNGTAGLVPINVSNSRLQAEATTEGVLTANLPSTAADVAAGDLPSANVAGSTSTARSSLVVYGNLGEEIILDVHFAKTTTVGEWEVTVYNSADRAASGGFPYGAAALAQTSLVFDATGALDASSANSLSIPVPGGDTLDLDLADMTQLSAAYSVREVNTNGNAPSDVASVDIDGDGTMYAIYENGQRRATYRIPLATVVSPDQLQPRTGNVFDLSSDSGDMLVGFAGTGGFGNVVSGALESSTVDLANELTDMIEAQRNYTVNSRVFQTGAELLEVLVNLKR